VPRFVRENRLVGASERDGGVTVLQSWRNGITRAWWWWWWLKVWGANQVLIATDEGNEDGTGGNKLLYLGTRPL